jgi:large subunit ribosomal protein L3
MRSQGSSRGMKMAAIIGKKLGMTRVFEEDGTAVSVTVVEAGPCVITRVRTKETDGYEAVQMGFDVVGKKSLTKPVLGQFAKAKVTPRRKITEFRVNNPGDYEMGQEIKADVFETGQLVDVTGWSRGRGFQGVTKRHGMSTGRQTHGNRNHRKPGSIGQSATPARVWKGKKLPGRMGGVRVTVKDLSVVNVDSNKNILLIRGAVPGASNGYLLITNAVRGVKK